jgi:hypothetical protein
MTKRDEILEVAKKAAIYKALQDTPAQISVEMFALSVAAKAFDAGYNYEPPEDPEFNNLLREAVGDINDRYRKEGYDTALETRQPYIKALRDLVERTEKYRSSVRSAILLGSVSGISERKAHLHKFETALTEALTTAKALIESGE